MTINGAAGLFAFTSRFLRARTLKPNKEEQLVSRRSQLIAVSIGSVLLVLSLAFLIDSRPTEPQRYTPRRPTGQPAELVDRASSALMARDPDSDRVPVPANNPSTSGTPLLKELPSGRSLAIVSQDEDASSPPDWYKEQMKSENRLLLKKTPEKLESDPFLNPSGLVLTDQEKEWLKQIIDEMYPRYHDAWQATGY